MTDSDTTSLFNEYEFAVIRLATFRSGTGPHRLLFGTVSLLPKNHPPPLGVSGVETYSLNGAGSGVSFRQAVLKVNEALEWYRMAGKDVMKTPVPWREEDRERRLDGKSVLSSDLIDDPKWPLLGLPLSKDPFSNPTPFTGVVPSRVHRRFGLQDGFSLLLGDLPALNFLQRRLHINFADYPEYLGSLVMIVPDFVIEEYDSFLIPATAEQSEKHLMRFVARPGQTFENLKITIIEKHENLLTKLETSTIPSDGLILINRTNEATASGFYVTHSTHGVLLHHPPTHFKRSAIISTSVVEQQRHVIVPIDESRSSALTEYKVDVLTGVNETVIGNKTPCPVSERIITATRRRTIKKAAKEYDQHWFEDGDREEAMGFIRHHISAAKKHIIIADPYFGVLQPPQYLLAITRNNVKVTLLTSKMAFEFSNDSEEPEINNSNVTSNFFKRISAANKELLKQKKKLESLLDKLEGFNNSLNNLSENGIKNLEALVLPGDSSPLHDRFLVVDNSVWFLGHSLNALGNRASMVLRVPDGEDVISRLSEMYSLTKPFDQYITSKRQQLESLNAQLSQTQEILPIRLFKKYLKSIQKIHLKNKEIIK